MACIHCGMKGEKYFLSFERSELDGKYSLFGSVHVVCMQSDVCVVVFG